jgi:N-acetyl-gamma-glutamyl-phosphate reductase
MKKIPVAIVGASGYTGLELIKILISHPKFEIVYLSTTNGEEDLFKLHPSLEKVTKNLDIKKTDPKEIAKVAKLVFLALPHKTAMTIAKELLELGIKVVDLSADYRLDQKTYEKFYCLHTDSKNLSHSIYGLIEYFEEEIKKASLVAGPGCYPTATLLGLLPFIPYIDTSLPIFIDAKSGVSGAGKKLSSTTHFVTINENIFAYNPISHRHAPEIEEKIKQLFKKETQVVFVPHLIPTTRGELVSIYATLKEEIDPIEILKEKYQNRFFIRIKDKPVDTKSVLGTHFCDIFAKSSKKALFISSAIDNLLRGASSQAVVAANLMMGFEETLGIPKIAYVP